MSEQWMRDRDLAATTTATVKGVMSTKIFMYGSVFPAAPPPPPPPRARSPAPAPAANSGVVLVSYIS